MKCTHCHTLIRPVVALDIDGTLGDYHYHFLTFLAQYMNVNPHTLGEWLTYDGIGELSDHVVLPKKVYHDAKVAFRAGGFKRWMPAFMGIKRLIDAAHESDVEVWVTTTRPWMRMDNIDPDTREWLHRNKVRYDGLLFDEDKYYQLSQRVEPERIVMILEDQFDMYDRATELSLPVVMRKTKWNRGIQRPLEIGTMASAAAHLVEATATWRQQHDQ